HSEGGPGAEHLHLLDRIRAAHDGGRAAVLHRAAGAQLLLRLDLRLPHRRGGRQPHLAARLHARQRLHHRRVLPGARHEDRRLRAESLVLLLERHGPGVRGHRSRRAAQRRAVAIQLIINRELGLNKIQNPWRGSFAIEHLTELVEEAVYKEFEELSQRGGVLGAMESMYQRGKIQEESLYYETRKHDGSLPIIGVNTFLSGADALDEHKGTQLIRSSEEEKQAQVAAVRAF